MKLAQILGYQIDVTRHAAVRSLQRLLADFPIGSAATTALLLVHEQPGCDQTTLGRALAGNRSFGMKVASRLEADGLLTRGEGRDHRSKGLYITVAGERMLERAILLQEQADATLSAYLTPAERETLLILLAKVQRALEDHESVGAEDAAPAAQGLLATAGADEALVPS